jgi:hypothetical protein
MSYVLPMLEMADIAALVESQEKRIEELEQRLIDARAGLVSGRIYCEHAEEVGKKIGKELSGSDLEAFDRSIRLLDELLSTPSHE